MVSDQEKIVITNEQPECELKQKGGKQRVKKNDDEGNVENM